MQTTIKLTLAILRFLLLHFNTIYKLIEVSRCLQLIFSGYDVICLLTDLF